MAESGLNWLEYIVGSSTGKYLEYLSYLFYDSSDRADAGPLFWLFCPALRTLEKLGNIFFIVNKFWKKCPLSVWVSDFVDKREIFQGEL